MIATSAEEAAAEFSAPSLNEVRKLLSRFHQKKEGSDGAIFWAWLNLSRSQFKFPTLTERYPKVHSMSFTELMDYADDIASIHSAWQAVKTWTRDKPGWEIPKLNVEPAVYAINRSLRRPEVREEFVMRLANLSGVDATYEELLKNRVLVKADTFLDLLAPEMSLQVIPSKQVFLVPFQVLDAVHLEPASNVCPVGDISDAVAETAVTLFGGSEFPTLTQATEAARNLEH